MVSRAQISLPMPEIERFCRRWGVAELALFGSVLRDDFGPESDVDMLATFTPDADVSLWDWGPMRDELRAIVGREVGLVEKSALRNPFRRRAILREHEVVYERRP